MYRFDVLWDLLVAFVVSVAIIIAGYTQGNVESLFFGTDANGMTCGSLNNNMGDKAVNKRDSPFIVYPRIQEDMVRQAKETNLNSLTETDLNNLKFYGVCVAACPSAGEWVCHDKALKSSTNPTLDECRSAGGGGAFLSTYNYPTNLKSCTKLMSDCHYQAFDTIDILFRCINVYPDGAQNKVRKCADPVNVGPDDDKCVKVVTNATLVNAVSSNKKDLVADQVTSAVALALRAFGDIWGARVIILVTGGLGGLILGVVWLVFLRYTSRCIVWTTIILALLSCFAFTMICWVKAGFISIPDSSVVPGTSELKANLAVDTDAKVVWTGAAYVTSVVSILLLLVVAYLRRKISIASAIISEASSAVASMPLIIFFPVPIMLILLVWLIIWFWGMGNLWTMREVPTVAGQNITAIMEAEQSPVKNYLMAYHTFLGLWVMNFIEGICTMTICGAFAGWYWTVPSKELSSTICCGRKSMYLKRVQKG